MQPHSVDVPHDPRQLRHELFSALTVIQSQTRLLQRHLQHMDDLVDGDRERLEAGLTVILASTQELVATIDHLPVISAPRRDGA
jgi:hypothetical protein